MGEDFGAKVRIKEINEYVLNKNLKINKIEYALR